MKSGAYEEAEKVFLGIVADYPSLAGPYCNLAIIYSKDAKYDDAIKFVERAIALDEKLAEAYNVRAQVEIEQGRITAAEGDYLKAIELRPGYVNAHYNLALLYDVYYQDVGSAVKHYEIYLSLLTQPDEATKVWVKRLKGAVKHG